MAHGPKWKPKTQIQKLRIRVSANTSLYPIGAGAAFFSTTSPALPSAAVGGSSAAAERPRAAAWSMLVMSGRQAIEARPVA